MMKRDKQAMRDVAIKVHSSTQEKVEFVGWEKDGDIIFQVTHGKTYIVFDINGNLISPSMVDNNGPIRKYSEILINKEWENVEANLKILVKIAARNWARDVAKQNKEYHGA